MELIRVADKTYYIKADTNIGVYKTGEKSVCIIDTGSKGFGEKIDEIISAQGWEIDYIINTHTHIDHLGGNEYLMKKYGIKAYCAERDIPFAHFDEFESSFINGGMPGIGLRRVFKHPGKIGFEPIEDNELEGIEWIYLPGHTFGMIGVKTSDDVWFLGDSYLSAEYLDRKSFGYLYNLDKYMDTLNMIKKLDGKLFIPSHGVAEEDITEIVDRNIVNVEKNLDYLREITSDYISMDHILQKMYGYMKLRNNVINQALLSSTTKGYIQYLRNRGEMEFDFIDNIMVWKHHKAEN